MEFAGRLRISLGNSVTHYFEGHRFVTDLPRAVVVPGAYTVEPQIVTHKSLGAYKANEQLQVLNQSHSFRNYCARSAKRIIQRNGKSYSRERLRTTQFNCSNHSSQLYPIGEQTRRSLSIGAFRYATALSSDCFRLHRFRQRLWIHLGTSTL